MKSRDGTSAAEVGDIEEGENVEVYSIFAEVSEEGKLKADENIFHRGLGDFVADFEAMSKSADMTIPLRQDILPASLQREIQIGSRGCL